MTAATKGRNHILRADLRLKSRVGAYFADMKRAEQATEVTPAAAKSDR
jgi:hypothetical protein